MDWTIGADIEMMLEKNGKLVSAVPLFPPDTEAAQLPYGTVFHDNVLAEFTIEPAKNFDEFVWCISTSKYSIYLFMKWSAIIFNGFNVKFIF